MKVEMSKKNNVSRISNIKYGDTFIFGNDVFMQDLDVPRLNLIFFKF